MESVNEYLYPFLRSETALYIRLLKQKRIEGVCSEKHFHEEILKTLRKENNLNRVKEALNRDFQLNSKISDHFLVMLLTRHGESCIDFIMRKVEYGIKRCRQTGVTKIYANDCAVAYDPMKNVLVTIYPRHTQ